MGSRPTLVRHLPRKEKAPGSSPGGSTVKLNRSTIVLPCGHTQRVIYAQSKVRARVVMLCRTCGERFNLDPEQNDHVFKK